MGKLVASSFAVFLCACVTGCSSMTGQQVTLLQPFEHASANSLAPMLRNKVADLAGTNPDNPVADDSWYQTLSLFGREDLIASLSADYQTTGCAPLQAVASVYEEIVRRARQTSIVIVNESHERSRGRGFAAEIARQLHPLGYDTLALETLLNPPVGTPEQYLPPFPAHPDRPYLEDEDGSYLSEASFGRLGRRAKALGYRLLPYEDNTELDPSKHESSFQRVAVREEAQANNLALFIRKHRTAKLLIHVGYSHAAEVRQPNGAKWMAARLKEKTGIDPLTISQTTCFGGSDKMRLSKLPNDEPAGTFDLIIDHPSERFTHGRPTWRKIAGDRIVAIPRTLRPTMGWRVIEARPLGEPATSVPLDRVAIRPGEDIALMLPPGRYHLRVIDVPANQNNKSTSK